MGQNRRFTVMYFKILDTYIFAIRKYIDTRESLVYIKLLNYFIIIKLLL